MKKKSPSNRKCTPCLGGVCIAFLAFGAIFHLFWKTFVDAIGCEPIEEIMSSK